MPEQLFLLFCESPFQKKKVDEDFESQFNAARENGFDTLLFNYEDLTSPNRYAVATKDIKPAEKLSDILYRGWMLTPEQYSILYNDLLSKNYKLVNNPREYQNCHYLPDSLQFIEDKTPKTIFGKYENEKSIDDILEQAKIFGNSPVILKDYVKSEKHDWETACFVENASDIDKLKQSVNNLISLRGKYLNEGIVIREFVPLTPLTNHSKSGMPLTEEYRLFFYNKKLIEVYNYWEEGEYNLSRPDTTLFEEIAGNIESAFFSMDIARLQNGEFIIIELGDGQVAGLPDNTDETEFYRKLKKHFYKI
ncbi:ATP-grasp domain-containing protein [Elizabethkingia anophelis]|uniref:ATP-grasp domain-containing protein n=1 Tax=Elizabethkingia anophelis TaxID=1117645 RepID=UPI00068E57AC|nr:ATP-grasp domain-containing protein [Elizabethkingia anophelis]MCT3648002.1 ATP-grasp domain-containing protein [Elizabethkingia anophelis]MCT3693667.1 ATP-grasp domain-containing protein [Elizabethkingia anophelis]MCT3699402.1 ATP-grasp domain-containing protein [Elizabethkingia anophelis]MCT3786896.1 ATP-grasp domain-containing protein [Elizabethkingia anophelis]MCT3858985.1 ATP-grasp domain-containing protein [Elizabethkingia anophelis]